MKNALNNQVGMLGDIFLWLVARNLYRKLEEVDFDQFLPRIGFLGRSEPASAEL